MIEKQDGRTDHGQLRWYVEPMSFETMYEAFEWVNSGIYNEIGSLYDGYVTTDYKLASALVFELTRINTISEYRCHVHCDYKYENQTTTYRVWVKAATSSADLSPE